MTESDMAAGSVWIWCHCYASQYYYHIIKINTLVPPEWKKAFITPVLLILEADQSFLLLSRHIVTPYYVVVVSYYIMSCMTVSNRLLSTQCRIKQVRGL